MFAWVTAFVFIWLLPDEKGTLYFITVADAVSSKRAEPRRCCIDRVG